MMEPKQAYGAAGVLLLLLTGWLIGRASGPQSTSEWRMSGSGGIFLYHTQLGTVYRYYSCDNNRGGCLYPVEVSTDSAPISSSSAIPEVLTS